MTIETYHRATYPAGTTGEQEMLQVNANHVCSAVVTVGAGTTANFDIQTQLVLGGDRHTTTAGATATTISNFTNPVTGIGPNITTNTGGTGLVLEVRTASRGA